VSTLTVTVKGQVTLRKDLLKHLGVVRSRNLVLRSHPTHPRGTLTVRAHRCTVSHNCSRDCGFPASLRLRPPSYCHGSSTAWLGCRNRGNHAIWPAIAGWCIRLLRQRASTKGPSWGDRTTYTDDQSHRRGKVIPPWIIMILSHFGGSIRRGDCSSRIMLR
jgi:hypothetical protein